MPGVSDDVLSRIPLLRRVKAAERSQVGAVARLVAYERGDVIFTEGDPSDVFLLIVEGRVKIFKSTPAGKDVILEIFGTGDPLGAVAVYETMPFPASAVALEPTRCLSVPQADFFRLLEAHPPLVRALLSGLTLRLAELTRRLADLSGSRVEARFARLFLKLADQMGRDERGGVFVPMALSRQDLADFTGTTIETAIRVMSRWNKDEIVLTDKDGFIVKSRDALEDAAST